MNSTFKVVELFRSFQGEGVNLGRPAIFVRLFGCNLACSFCDEPLHKDAKRVVFEGSANKLVTLMLAQFSGAFISSLDPKASPMIIFTGGEPTLYNLNEIMQRLREVGFTGDFAVESNGRNAEALYNLPGNPFVTISPKTIEDLNRIDFSFLTRGEVRLVANPLADFLEAAIAVLAAKDGLDTFEIYCSAINDEKSVIASHNSLIAQKVGELNDLWCERLKKQIRLNVQAQKVWGVK